MTHMRFIFRILHLYFSAKPLPYHYLINKISCAVSLDEGKNEDTVTTECSNPKYKETVDGTVDLNFSNYFTTELEMSVDGLMSEHSYSEKTFHDKFKAEYKNQKLLLFGTQKKLIKNIKSIIVKLHEIDNWKDSEERSNLKSLLLQFIYLIKMISSSSMLSLKKHLDNVDYNMPFLKKNVDNILKFKSLLIEDIKDKNISLNKIACLKETFKNTSIFYSKIKDEFQFLAKKREKMCKNVLKLRHSFISRIEYIEKNLKIIEHQCFNSVRAQMLKFLYLFDQKHFNHLKCIFKSLDKLVKILLKKIVALNDSMRVFVHQTD